MTPTPEQFRVLEADRWFGGLSADRRALILSAAMPAPRADGTLIYATGDPPNGLWAVLSGRVRLLDYPHAGAEVLVRTLGQGEWFGELSTIDGGPRPQDAVASGATLLLHVSIPRFSALTAAHPELHRDLALLACAHQRAALAFIGQRTARSIEARIAGVLLQTAGTNAARIDIRQSELAIIVGVSRQTLNKRLKRFERAGALRLRYGGLDILDASPLETALLAGDRI